MATLRAREMARGRCFIIQTTVAFCPIYGCASTDGTPATEITMTDKDVERVKEALDWLVYEEVEGRDAWLDDLARVVIAAYESAVTAAVKLGTVSLTSFDGHCVRIDFPNREDAERMYAVLTGTGE
jgi:hypothetical protein